MSTGSDDMAASAHLRVLLDTDSFESRLRSDVNDFMEFWRHQVDAGAVPACQDISTWLEHFVSFCHE